MIRNPFGDNWFDIDNLYVLYINQDAHKIQSDIFLKHLRI